MKFHAHLDSGRFCTSYCEQLKTTRGDIIIYSRLVDVLEDYFVPCQHCNPVFNSMQMECENVDSLLINPLNALDFDVFSKENHILFEKQHEISLQEYASFLRRNDFSKKIYENRSGKEVINHILQMNLKHSAFVNALEYSIFESPLGQLIGVKNNDGIVFFDFLNSIQLFSNLEKFATDYKATFVEIPNDFLQNKIDSYFTGQSVDFEVDMVFNGTDFQCKVWQELKNISYGEKSTYKKIAERIELKNSVRAVANAVGKNKLIVMIPCHRVYGSNGSITGFSAGLWRKKYLENLESKMMMSYGIVAKA